MLIIYGTLPDTPGIVNNGCKNSAPGGATLDDYDFQLAGVSFLWAVAKCD
jgi:hypothetical protein